VLYNFADQCSNSSVLHEYLGLNLKLYGSEGNDAAFQFRGIDRKYDIADLVE